MAVASTVQAHTLTLGSSLLRLTDAFACAQEGPRRSNYMLVAGKHPSARRSKSQRHNAQNSSLMRFTNTKLTTSHCEQIAAHKLFFQNCKQNHVPDRNISPWDRARCLTPWIGSSRPDVRQFEFCPKLSKSSSPTSEMTLVLHPTAAHLEIPPLA